MAEDSDDGYSLAELFVLKFVLADVLIIFVLLFAGVWYAIGLAALFVVSTFLVWYLTNRDPPRPEAATVGASETADTAVDPLRNSRTGTLLENSPKRSSRRNSSG